MTPKATESFWKSYDKLPASVQRTADKIYELLEADPRYPLLQLKETKPGL